MVAWRDHRCFFPGIGALRRGRYTGWPLAGPPWRTRVDDGGLLRRDTAGAGMGIVRDPFRVLSGLGSNWAGDGHRALRARIRRGGGLVRPEASEGADCGHVGVSDALERTNRLDIQVTEILARSAERVAKRPITRGFSVRTRELREAPPWKRWKFVFNICVGRRIGHRGGLCRIPSSAITWCFWGTWKVES